MDRDITFLGLMTMIGVECDWRMTWTRVSDDKFQFVNEEKTPHNDWAYVDEWHFKRRAMQTATGSISC